MLEGITMVGQEKEDEDAALLRVLVMKARILYLGLVVVTQVNICNCACLPGTVRSSNKTKPNTAGFHSSQANLSDPRYSILGWSESFLY